MDCGVLDPGITSNGVNLTWTVPWQAVMIGCLMETTSNGMRPVGIGVRSVKHHVEFEDEILKQSYSI